MRESYRRTTGLTRKRPSRLAAACLGALCIAAFVLIAGASTAVRADEADERIDRRMRAFEDPKLLQILTSAPAPRAGRQGPQPFNQQPPAAQSNFQIKTPFCFRDVLGRLVCR